MNRTQAILVGGSLALHVALGVWMGFLPKQKKQSSVAIALAESQKKKDEAKPPPPPPPPAAVQPAPVRAKVAAPAPKPEAVEPPPTTAPRPASAGDAPSAMDGFADLGLAMGGNGMALPAGNGGRGGAPAPAAAQPAVRKVKELAPALDECHEDPVKPQLDHQAQPAYTSEGRQASIEGVVKLEVSVDEAGRVTQVRVVKGLGYGLDEAAVAAARQWTFKPATRCGKPVSYVVKPGVRFQLGS